jgi:Tripartite tricarboxylate transporter TctB family
MARDNAEFLSAAVVVGVGIFSLYLAYTIKTFEEEILVGPRLVPIAIAVLGISLGVLLFAVTWVGHVKSGKVVDSKLSGISDGKQSSLSKIAVLRMAAIIVLGFVYIWLFSATGYLIATAITMASLLVVFGIRPAGKVAVLTIGGTAVYYIIFIQLMGIYSPPGWLINLEMLGL